jgi:large subunit ribosomal protein L18
MRKLIRVRRRKALTDYSKRIALLKSGSPRAVVRRSNRAISMQVIAYELDGDKVLKSVNSRELKAFGWEPRCNMPTAYLTGLLLAKKAAELKGKRLVLDTGIYRPVKGAVIFAAAKGSIDGGLDIAANIEIDAKRLSGAHIAGYAANKEALSKSTKHQFAAYAKAGFDAAKMSERFEEVKKKIISG